MWVTSSPVWLSSARRVVVFTTPSTTLFTLTIRNKIERTYGDIIEVEIKKDKEERVVELPKEFANLLDNNMEAKEFYESLSYSNKRKYIQWITSAKKEETQIKRMDEAIIKLKDKIKIK